MLYGKPVLTIPIYLSSEEVFFKDREVAGRRKVLICKIDDWTISVSIDDSDDSEVFKMELIDLISKSSADLPRKNWFIDLDYYNKLINSFDVEQFIENFS